MIGRHLARNAVAYLALVVATSGTAYAAATIGSAQVVNDSLRSVDLRDGAAVKGVDVVNGSLTGRDVKGDSLTGRQVKERSLGEVPRAALAGRRIDYGKVVASSSADQKVVLEFRGISLRTTCFGYSWLKLEARSSHPFTSLDGLFHTGPTSNSSVESTGQSGMWLSTSGPDVGVWKLPAELTGGSYRRFQDLYFQWSGGTMAVHVVMKVINNPDGTATCFVAGTATSGV